MLVGVRCRLAKLAGEDVSGCGSARGSAGEQQPGLWVEVMQGSARGVAAALSMDHCGQRRWQQHGAAAEVEVGFVVALVDVGGGERGDGGERAPVEQDERSGGPDVVDPRRRSAVPHVYRLRRILPLAFTRSSSIVESRSSSMRASI